MANSINLKRSQPEVAKLLQKTYPDYNGRKIRLSESNKYYMSDYWDGGTKRYCVAYNLATGETATPSAIVNNPMNQAAHQVFEIPDGFAIVEHTIFCGQDIGISINVNSNTFPKMLKSGS